MNMRMSLAPGCCETRDQIVRDRLHDSIYSRVREAEGHGRAWKELREVFDSEKARNAEIHEQIYFQIPELA